MKGVPEEIAFEATMLSMEEKLEKESPPTWSSFEEETGEFWRSIEAEGWGEAFRKDPMACVFYQQFLSSTLNA
jgi:hypothetical protein